MVSSIFRNVVDVSAMSPHSVEQQEYMDRSRQYRYDAFRHEAGFCTLIIPDLVYCMFRLFVCLLFCI